MEQFDLEKLIEGVVRKFERNRTGIKPAVLVELPADFPPLVWLDTGLEKFVNLFFYDLLLMNDPERPVRIAVDTRTALRDLDNFAGLTPPYWVQLRIHCRGPANLENLIDERLAALGYAGARWAGIPGSFARLAMFSPIAVYPSVFKIVCCVDSTTLGSTCDLLLPAQETLVSRFPIIQTKKA